MVEAIPPIIAWGVDHHHSAIGIRERLAVASADPIALATLLQQLPGASECIVVATCNRLEVYLGGKIERHHLETALAERAGLEAGQLASQAYFHVGEACARHLFRVASGLESMVLGEAEVAGQLRRAYEATRSAGLAGRLLHPLFQRALSCGKDVRNRTGIGDHKLSVASMAVDLARQVHGNLSTARLLIVGAGETAELSARYLSAAGIRTITVINRTAANGQELATRIGGTAAAWELLPDNLASHDVIVSSTAAPHPVITRSMVRSAIHTRRAPLVFIDLAVPRDVEPAAAELDDVFLFNVDHLERVVAKNLGNRQKEVAAAEALITTSVNEWRLVSDASRAEFLARISRYFNAIVTAEETRLAAKLPEADRQQLRYGLDRVGNKLLHPILAWTKAHADDPEAQRFISELLNLESSPADTNSRTSEHVES
ncbi:MAG: glutamyl-tRNA reductase [Planctomycetota bacterium]